MSNQTAEKPADSMHVTHAHAHWLPLLVFASLLVAGAARQVAQFWAEMSLGPEPVVTYVVHSSDTLVLAGAAVSAAWFHWLGRAGAAVGRWVPAALTWGIGALLLPPLLASGLSTILPAGPVLGPLEQNASLVLVGAGLLVLAAVQRSRRLSVVALAYSAVAVVCTYASPQNQLYDVLGLFGVRDEDMPWVLGEAFAAFLPGLVLIVGFADSWRHSLRSLAAEPSRTLLALAAPSE